MTTNTPTRLDPDSKAAVQPETPARAMTAQSPVKPAVTTAPAKPAAPAKRLDADSRALG